jgi:hypothetical protein
MCPLDQDRTIYIPTDGLSKILHPSSTICPKGYYCPTKTEDYTPNACPDGFYNPFDGGSGISSCYKCPEGKMCQGTALIATTGDCPIGYYCSFDAVG